MMSPHHHNHITIGKKEEKKSGFLGAAASMWFGNGSSNATNLSYGGMSLEDKKRKEEKLAYLRAKAEAASIAEEKKRAASEKLRLVGGGNDGNNQDIRNAAESSGEEKKGGKNQEAERGNWGFSGLLSGVLSGSHTPAVQESEPNPGRSELTELSQVSVHMCLTYIIACIFHLIVGNTALIEPLNVRTPSNVTKTLPILPQINQTLGDRASTAHVPESARSGRGAGTARSVHSRSSMMDELDNLLPRPYMKTQIVDDLDEPVQIRPDLVGYPLTIAEIMRYTRDRALADENKEAWKGYGLPVLSQQLKIGDATRRSAAKLRDETEKKRIKAEEELEAEKKAAWLAIPPMKRGFVINKALRDKGRMVLLQAYIMPNKPNNVMIKGHVLDECKKLQLNLPLSAVGNHYGKCLHWWLLVVSSHTTASIPSH